MSITKFDWKVNDESGTLKPFCTSTEMFCKHFNALVGADIQFNTSLPGSSSTSMFENDDAGLMLTPTNVNDESDQQEKTTTNEINRILKRVSDSNNPLEKKTKKSKDNDDKNLPQPKRRVLPKDKTNIANNDDTTGWRDETNQAFNDRLKKEKKILEGIYIYIAI